MPELDGPGDGENPVAKLANANGLWGIDQPMFGAIFGGLKIMAREGEPYRCFDTSTDPAEQKPLAGMNCGPAYRAVGGSPRGSPEKPD